MQAGGPEGSISRSKGIVLGTGRGIALSCMQVLDYQGPVKLTFTGLLRSAPVLVALSGAGLVAEPPGNPVAGGAPSMEMPASVQAEAAARYSRGDWVMVWNDEFDTGTAPSPKKWGYEEGLIRNNELQYYTKGRAENARIEGGALVITGRREDYRGSRYTSASLNTKGRFEFTYGKVEVRAKFPTGRGTWPAIWLLGDESKGGWPRCGEIDIMENVGFDPAKIHFTVHTGAFNGAQGTQKTNAVVRDRPWEDYHRYGIIWTHERIEFFLDGEKVSEFANDGLGVDHWPFDSPEYLILNLALGGNWGGKKGVDDSIFPAEFRVDYVRVWKSPRG